MDRQLQRVHALRLRGRWTASADDGVRIGHGAGVTWAAAVRAAIQALDEEHAAEVHAQDEKHRQENQ